MPIQRGSTPTKALFTVGLNITLRGSKGMSAEEQDALMQVGAVRILITDDAYPDTVLVDQVLEAAEFNTGSVGYKLHAANLEFEER